MKDKNTLQPPAEPLQHERSMQKWMDAAHNSEDIRDRVAMTCGLSRGVFGNLSFTGTGVEDGTSSNDSEYFEEQHSAQQLAPQKLCCCKCS